MMKKNKIYVTTMYRWGDREAHSYVLYAGFSKHAAIKAGADERIDRGDKYIPGVDEFTPGDIKSRKTILSIDKHPDIRRKSDMRRRTHGEPGRSKICTEQL